MLQLYKINNWLNQNSLDYNNFLKAKLIRLQWAKRRALEKIKWLQNLVSFSFVLQQSSEISKCCQGMSYLKWKNDLMSQRIQKLRETFGIKLVSVVSGFPMRNVKFGTKQPKVYKKAVRQGIGMEKWCFCFDFLTPSTTIRFVI